MKTDIIVRLVALGDAIATRTVVVDRSVTAEAVTEIELLRRLVRTADAQLGPSFAPLTAFASVHDDPRLFAAACRALGVDDPSLWLLVEYCEHHVETVPVHDDGSTCDEHGCAICNADSPEAAAVLWLDLARRDDTGVDVRWVPLPRRVAEQEAITL